MYRSIHHNVWGVGVAIVLCGSVRLVGARTDPGTKRYNAGRSSDLLAEQRLSKLYCSLSLHALQRMTVDIECQRNVCVAEALRAPSHEPVSRTAWRPGWGEARFHLPGRTADRGPRRPTGHLLHGAGARDDGPRLWPWFDRVQSPFVRAPSSDARSLVHRRPRPATDAPPAAFPQGRRRSVSGRGPHLVSCPSSPTGAISDRGRHRGHIPKSF